IVADQFVGNDCGTRFGVLKAKVAHFKPLGLVAGDKATQSESPLGGAYFDSPFPARSHFQRWTEVGGLMAWWKFAAWRTPVSHAGIPARTLAPRASRAP